MIEKYIELKLITEFYIPAGILVVVAIIVIMARLIRWIAEYWEKRQNRMIDKYFREHPDEEEQNGKRK